MLAVAVKTTDVKFDFTRTIERNLTCSMSSCPMSKTWNDSALCSFWNDHETELHFMVYVYTWPAKYSLWVPALKRWVNLFDGLQIFTLVWLLQVYLSLMWNTSSNPIYDTNSMLLSFTYTIKRLCETEDIVSSIVLTKTN